MPLVLMVVVVFTGVFKKYLFSLSLSHYFSLIISLFLFTNKKKEREKLLSFLPHKYSHKTTQKNKEEEEEEETFLSFFLLLSLSLSLFLLALQKR